MPHGRGHDVLRRLRLLDRRRDDPGPERLRQHQGVAGTRPDVAPDSIGMDQADDGVPDLRLGVVDRVAADDVDPRLPRLLGAALEDLAEKRHRQLVPRKPDDRQHGDRTRVHRVDVGQGIGGRDLSERTGVVDDGREVVHRQHEGQLVRETVDGRVVGCLRPDQEVRVHDRGKHAQHLGQLLWPELAGSAGAVGERRQANRSVHPRITSLAGRSLRTSRIIEGRRKAGQTRLRPSSSPLMKPAPRMNTVAE